MHVRIVKLLLVLAIGCFVISACAEAGGVSSALPQQPAQPAAPAQPAEAAPAPEPVPPAAQAPPASSASSEAMAPSAAPASSAASASSGCASIVSPASDRWPKCSAKRTARSDHVQGQ